MKYKTVIEIVCDGNDEEEASHMAGEYLRGHIQDDVLMKCRTFVVSEKMMKHIGIGTMLFMGIFILLITR